MSLIIDRKFVSLVSPKLDKFQQKNDYIWNFRCPICGDSQKNKFKARGYIYRRKSDLFFSCHNCGTSLSMGNFLKTLDKNLYNEYRLERYKEENHGNVAKPDFAWAKEKPQFTCEHVSKINLPTVASLHEEHEAKTYLLNRKLPRDVLDTIYYTSDFKAFVHEMLPNYEKKLIDGDKRIIIPFYDENNNLLGFQGRALDKSKIRYITIKLDEDNPKVFGLDRIDFTKKIYVVEGPIDSLFLQNSIAMMDASLYNAILLLGDKDYVFVYDNEPRNPDIVKHMKKTIDMGRKVCIWPKNIVDKDINDMIMNGMSASQIQDIIDKNTHEDLKAQMEFTVWKKV